MASNTSKLIRVLSRQHVAPGAVARREFSAMVTPTDEFPGVPATSPSAAAAGQASVTTLANGLTVVSETGAAASTISITYPNAGSSSETTSESGAALANKFLCLKSGSGLSSAIILRNLENAGAKPFTTVDKSSASVGYTASKEQAVRILPLIATVSDLTKWDVKEAQDFAAFESKEAASNLMSVVSDSIYAAAYGAQSPLGKSLYSSSSSFVGIESFRQKAYGLDGAVLAATGIDDHESFVKAVEEGLSESYVGSNTPAPVSAFIGGETRVNAPSVGASHITLAFQGPKNASPLLNVVKSCIELSSEGSVSAYSSSQSGLIAAYASSTDGAAVTDHLCGVMSTIPSADIIARAKGVAKATALFSVDGGDSQSLASAMTASVLESGSFATADIAAAYDAVTVDEVQAVFSALDGPAFAAVGDLSSVPYHGTVASNFSS